MSKQHITITLDDIDRDGIINFDFSSWHWDIDICGSEMSIVEIPISVGNIISNSEVSIFQTIECSSAVFNHAHIRGHFKCDGNVKSKDLLIDGDCVIDGNIECDNISVLGQFRLSGNIKCKGRINFLSRSIIFGKENYSYGKKLDPRIPIVFLDQCSSPIPFIDSNNVMSERICIMFMEDKNDIVLLSGEKMPMEIKRFEYEFGEEFPAVSKYISGVRAFLNGET